MRNISHTDSNDQLQDRRLCPYCDEDISINAKICKHCKSALSPRPQIEGMDNTDRSALRTKAEWNGSIKVKDQEKEKQIGGVGCLGIILCFTGIGMIIGIPMIAWAMFSSNKAKGAWYGKCPKCDEDLYWHDADKNTQQGAFECPSCKVLVDFYSGEFIHRTL